MAKISSVLENQWYYTFNMVDQSLLENLLQIFPSPLLRDGIRVAVPARHRQEQAGRQQEETCTEPFRCPVCEHTGAQVVTPYPAIAARTDQNGHCYLPQPPATQTPLPTIIFFPVGTL